MKRLSRWFGGLFGKRARRQAHDAQDRAREVMDRRAAIVEKRIQRHEDMLLLRLQGHAGGGGQ